MNATLVIDNNEQFANDIWQDESSFSTAEWKVQFDEWIDFLYTIRREYQEKEWSGSLEEYTLGDIINFFSSIDVKVN